MFVGVLADACGCLGVLAGACDACDCQIAPVVEADKVLVMHRGEIVEQGTHVSMICWFASCCAVLCRTVACHVARACFIV